MNSTSLLNTRSIILLRLHTFIHPITNWSALKVDRPRIMCITVDKTIMPVACSQNDADRMKLIDSSADLNSPPRSPPFRDSRDIHFMLCGRLVRIVRNKFFQYPKGSPVSARSTRTMIFDTLMEEDNCHCAIIWGHEHLLAFLSKWRTLALAKRILSVHQDLSIYFPEFSRTLMSLEEYIGKSNSFLVSKSKGGRSSGSEWS